MLELFHAPTLGLGHCGHGARGHCSSLLGAEPGGRDAEDAELMLPAMPMRAPRVRSHKALARAISLLAPVEKELVPLTAQPSSRRTASAPHLPTAMFQAG